MRRRSSPVLRISGWVSRAVTSRRSRFVEDALGRPDASRLAGGLRPDRDREIAGEENVALDPHAEGQDNRSEFLDRETAQFRMAEIGEAEERVAIGVQLGRKPDAFAQRVEELDDRHMVSAAFKPIGEQALAQIVGQEDHAALLSFARSPAVSVSGRNASSQSAALLAWDAARTMARLSSRSTSSHDPM